MADLPKIVEAWTQGARMVFELNRASGLRFWPTANVRRGDSESYVAVPFDEVAVPDHLILTPVAVLGHAIQADLVTWSMEFLVRVKSEIVDPDRYEPENDPEARDAIGTFWWTKLDGSGSVIDVHSLDDDGVLLWKRQTGEAPLWWLDLIVPGVLPVEPVEMILAALPTIGLAVVGRREMDDGT